MNSVVQTYEVTLQVCSVVAPRQPIDARRSFSLEFEICQPEQIHVYVVQKRSELLLLPCPCYLPYAFQRMGHAYPVLCPARALLVRISLGLRPSLHSLRNRLPGLVRELLR
jgi:hypothetical protein